MRCPHITHSKPGPTRPLEINSTLIRKCFSWVEVLKKGLYYYKIGNRSGSENQIALGESDRTRGIGTGSRNRITIGKSDPNSRLRKSRDFRVFISDPTFVRSEHFRDHKILLLLGWCGGGLSAYEQCSFNCFVSMLQRQSFGLRAALFLGLWSLSVLVTKCWPKQSSPNCKWILLITSSGFYSDKEQLGGLAIVILCWC